MTKTAHFLTSLIFALVCAALWFLWKLGAGYLTGLVGDQPLSTVMTYALIGYPWLFAGLPVPTIIYSAVLMDRTELLPEKALLYLVIICLVSFLLFATSVFLFWLELDSMHWSLGNA
jgi:hypothetical protein